MDYGQEAFIGPFFFGNDREEAGRIIFRNSEVKWPPRSYDLTPLDYFFGGYLISKVYVNAPRTIQDFKRNIPAEIEAIDQQLLQKVIENFDVRMDGL